MKPSPHFYYTAGALDILWAAASGLIRRRERCYLLLVRAFEKKSRFLAALARSAYKEYRQQINIGDIPGLFQEMHASTAAMAEEYCANYGIDKRLGRKRSHCCQRMTWM